MQSHDGEALAKMLQDTGMKVGVFAARMGVERGTPRRWFDVVNHPDERLRQAAKVLQLNLGDYIPRFAAPAPPFAASSPSVAQQFSSTLSSDDAAISNNNDATSPTTLPHCMAQLLHWQQRAYENLEKYNSLLLRYIEMQSPQRTGSTEQSIKPTPHAVH